MHTSNNDENTKSPDGEAAIQTEKMPKECRICLDSTGAPSEFVSPCRCSGSMKWVHRECLSEWMRLSKDPLHRMMCFTCRYAYRRELRYRPPSECARALAPHIGWTVARFALNLLISTSLHYYGLEGWTVVAFSSVFQGLFCVFHLWMMHDGILANESLALSNDFYVLSNFLLVMGAAFADGGWDRVVELAVNQGLLAMPLLYALATCVNPRWKVYRRLAEGTLFEVGDVSDALPIDSRG